MDGRLLRIIAVVVTGTVGLASCTSDDPAPPAPTISHEQAASATSRDVLGGQDALVAAGRAEGALTVMSAADRAGTPELIALFTQRYGIPVSAVPPVGTVEELAALVGGGGGAPVPDVLELSTPLARQAAAQGLLAPYQVAAWESIPGGQKDPQGTWYADFGEYVSIGCNDTALPDCPEAFGDLIEPDFVGRVALTGDPNVTGSALAGVWAASLANGGSLDDIGRGIDLFGQLVALGRFTSVQATQATVASGETPVVIDWEGPNRALTEPLAREGITWEVNVPPVGLFAEFSTQAISTTAPHPAAARLWEEFLYSIEGQNTRLRGGARPALLPGMQQAGTADLPSLGVLPSVGGVASFPTPEQQTVAQQVIAGRWDATVPG